jgi:hypothetical protein
MDTVAPASQKSFGGKRRFGRRKGLSLICLYDIWTWWAFVISQRGKLHTLLRV